MWSSRNESIADGSRRRCSRVASRISGNATSENAYSFTPHIVTCGSAIGRWVLRPRGGSHRNAAHVACIASIGGCAAEWRVYRRLCAGIADGCDVRASPDGVDCLLCPHGRRSGNPAWPLVRVRLPAPQYLSSASGRRCPRFRGVHLRHLPRRHCCRRSRHCPARPPVHPRVVIATSRYCGLLRDRCDRAPLDSLERSGSWCTAGFRPGRTAGLGLLARHGRTVCRSARCSSTLWRSHPNALGWLAVVEGWLLVTGTVAAWVMLSHAGADATSGNASDKAGE